MKAFDTDILTELLAGNPAYAERLANVPLVEQSAPIVAVEEILRGRPLSKIASRGVLSVLLHGPSATQLPAFLSISLDLVGDVASEY